MEYKDRIISLLLSLDDCEAVAVNSIGILVDALLKIDSSTEYESIRTNCAIDVSSCCSIADSLSLIL